MADEAIKPGDVVQLKSGGPLMTVRAIEGDLVYCDWFEKTKAFSGRYKLHQLNKATRGSGLS